MTPARRRAGSFPFNSPPRAQVGASSFSWRKQSRLEGSFLRGGHSNQFARKRLACTESNPNPPADRSIIIYLTCHLATRPSSRSLGTSTPFLLTHEQRHDQRVRSALRGSRECTDLHDIPKAHINQSQHTPTRHCSANLYVHLCPHRTEIASTGRISTVSPK